MRGFPLTKKRLLSMPQARRHKWLKKWLEDLYCDILNDQIQIEILPGLMAQYKLIVTWLAFQYTSCKFDVKNKKCWLEHIANLVHIHQQQTNIGRHEEDLLPKVKKGDNKPLEKWRPKYDYGIALDNIRSAFNVGSICRTTDGAGLGFLLLGGYTPGKENSQVNKTSMNTVSWIPCVKTESLEDSLKIYKKSGYIIIGIETIENSQAYHSFTWPSKAIIVFGNEEYGISNNVLSVCDEFVHIPMYGHKNSINIANAYAVIAFTIASQLQ